MTDQNLLTLDDEPLLVATDGFRAELDAIGQNAMLDGQLPTVAGDCGVLLISQAGDGCSTEIASVHSDQSLCFRRV